MKKNNIIYLFSIIVFIPLHFISCKITSKVENKNNTKIVESDNSKNNKIKGGKMTVVDTSFFKTEEGLEYRLTQSGVGENPKQGDWVEVHYTGKLLNDSVFDSSIRRGQPFRFRLGMGMVIKGWDIGVALLKIGSKAIFRIPSNLAYGNQAVGPIPANSTLIFEVELLSISPNIIPKLFDTSNKEIKTTESGLKIISISKGNGEHANVGDTVVVHYTGYMEDGKIFDSSVDSGEPISFPYGLGGLIKGWEEGLGLMTKGEKAKLIIPPSLAYGENGIPDVIPPNSTLMFDIELINIIKK